jgi:hypothetical protein
MHPLLPYITQNISICDFYKEIFVVTEFFIKLINIKFCANILKIEGSYGLLKFGKINVFQIHSFETFESVLIQDSLEWFLSLLFWANSEFANFVMCEICSACVLLIFYVIIGWWCNWKDRGPKWPHYRKA